MLVRRMTEADAFSVSVIEQQCFSQPWSQQGFIDALAMEDNILLVAQEGEEILGYVCMYVSIDEGEITNVAVSEKSRKNGIGHELMKAIAKEALDNKISRIVLEVRKSNEPAKELYRKVGYKELGIRKNFYEQPVEDACIMECIIC